MIEDERLWLDSYGFVYSGDGKRLLRGGKREGSLFRVRHWWGQDCDRLIRNPPKVWNFRFFCLPLQRICGQIAKNP